MFDRRHSDSLLLLDRIQERQQAWAFWSDLLATRKDAMTFEEAVQAYSKLRPLVSKRDHAIVQAVTDSVGSAAIGALVATTIGADDDAALGVIRANFIAAIEANTTEVPLPASLTDLDWKSPSEIQGGIREPGEIRADGHLYVHGKRVD